ncbi:MAG: HNH endonuclease [Planctomycetota bacterium]
MNGRELDTRVRLAAFAFLQEQVRLHGEVLPASLLRRGFDFEGRAIRLSGPEGIFKPAILPEVPLSIRTAPPVEGRPAPYADRVEGKDIFLYCYRGTDPAHPDNEGLRKAMALGIPLVYLIGISKGAYQPEWPVYVVGDDPDHLEFRVQIDQRDVLGSAGGVAESGAEARRAYITAAVQKRVHQRVFSDRVVRAYRRRCAICRLGHKELLDAAHILPDTHPKGEPVVPNGLCLCKLHHGAFDASLLGIRPDLVVEVRADVLREEDGPVLVHGLQKAHGERILVPREPPLHPDRDRLAERYEGFKKAG